MATIADKLNYLRWTKSDIRDAIRDKGVDVPEDIPFRQYADKIDAISGGGKTFGISISDLIGTVDGDGVLNKSTAPFVLDLTGVKTIGGGVFQEKFLASQNIEGFIAPDVRKIENNGMDGAINGSTCKGKISMPRLASVGMYGLYSGFQETQIEAFLAPSLGTVKAYGCCYMCYLCQNLTEVDLSMLMQADDMSFLKAFAGTKITKISFPALYTVATDAFAAVDGDEAIFTDCELLTEIHFARAVQSKIEAMYGYADKWGASNAQIFFDL